MARFETFYNSLIVICDNYLVLQLPGYFVDTKFGLTKFLSSSTVYSTALLDFLLLSIELFIFQKNNDIQRALCLVLVRLPGAARGNMTILLPLGCRVQL